MRSKEYNRDKENYDCISVYVRERYRKNSRNARSVIKDGV
jgi:hypothetical protein